MILPELQIAHATTLLAPSDVQKMVAACQRKIDCDLAPVWLAAAVFHFIGDGKPDPAIDVLRVVDKSSDAGALGWHSIGSGEVAISDSIADGVQPSSVLDHELSEWTVDRILALMFFTTDGMLAMGEASDPVEDSDPDYKIDGYVMENCVTPAYFGIGSGRYDLRGKLTAPWAMTANGYQSIFDPKAGQWTQRTAGGCRASKLIASPSSRRARRMLRTGHRPEQMRIEVV